jgi:hypothetical protein
VAAINPAHLDGDLPLPAAGAARMQLNFVGVPIAQRSAAPAIAQFAVRRAGRACRRRQKGRRDGVTLARA